MVFAARFQGSRRALQLQYGSSCATPVDSSLPLWPILWGGTALIALVTAGLLVILRDRRIRPVSGSQEPDQGVPSPSGPIRMDWVEPDG